uniref:Uncharacterized protein n=1 Tax=Coccidioides posadasii RMSCC 3488 TaxID=454284 RepID=A0A0J6F474_COCPO|nr:hypothetical protein CPAG_00118 [Coccidioides posadasii RMSCC 3488]
MERVKGETCLAVNVACFSIVSVKPALELARGWLIRGRTVQPRTRIGRDEKHEPETALCRVRFLAALLQSTKQRIVDFGLQAFSCCHFARKVDNQEQPRIWVGRRRSPFSCLLLHHTAKARHRMIRIVTIRCWSSETCGLGSPQLHSASFHSVSSTPLRWILGENSPSVELGCCKRRRHGVLIRCWPTTWVEREILERSLVPLSMTP